MFKGVQKRLTVLYTLTTGAILVILLGCIFLWNINNREQAEAEAFQNLWVSASSRLHLDSVISDTYLAQTEVSSRAIIHIEENGAPLLFSGAYSAKTSRDRLIELAYERAGEEGVFPSMAPVSSSSTQTSTFEMEGESGDHYHGRLVVMATGTGVKSLLLLSYITPRSEFLRQSAPLFLLSCAAGILGILIVSWFFTGWSLKPAKEGAKKQADFIAAASHELRSPLAVIRSSASVLQGMAAEKNVPEAPYDAASKDAFKAADITAEKLLSGIDRECSRMARLVGDMLLLASSDAKNWTLDKTAIETDTLLIETYESFLPICHEKKLTLSLELPEEPLPKITADRQRLEQILTILMDNAVSYTPAGRSITIKCHVESRNRTLISRSAPLSHTAQKFPSGVKGLLILEVLDRGPGIPEELIKHIFDRFYRADASRNDKSHFGLGLSIAKELIEIHGGSISAQNRDGGGSQFIVQLPIQ